MTFTNKAAGTVLLLVMLLGFAVAKLATQSRVKAIRGVDVEILKSHATVAKTTAQMLKRNGCPSDEFIKDLERGVCGYVGLIAKGRIKPIYIIEVNAAIRSIQGALRQIKQYCGHQDPTPCNLSLS